jgi:pyruvate formate lyase activating enzyme
MRILNIQRMSTEDGPGLRTTLFAKGCPLRCAWCHNPESLSHAFQIEWLAERCIGCKTCVAVCPENALTMTDEGLVIDRERCSLCLLCAKECPTMAIETKGEDQTVDALFNELIKDRAYFGQDGGVTLSGGEILSQAEDAAALLKRLREAGIHTAVDTSGLCTQETLDKVLPYVDLVLYDLKLFDRDAHKQWTGVENDIILGNFQYLLDKKRSLGFTLWVRTPVIPGATDSDDNIQAIAKIVGNNAERWEL